MKRWMEGGRRGKGIEMDTGRRIVRQKEEGEEKEGRGGEKDELGLFYTLWSGAYIRLGQRNGFFNLFPHVTYFKIS